MIRGSCCQAERFRHGHLTTHPDEAVFLISEVGEGIEVEGLSRTDIIPDALSNVDLARGALQSLRRGLD